MNDNFRPNETDSFSGAAGSVDWRVGVLVIQ
jgi:hypothetical protein